MKLIAEYNLDTHIGNGQSLLFEYYSAVPLFYNDCIYYPHGKGIICCTIVSLNGNVTECNFAVPPEYKIAWPHDWKMFVFNGHVILSCEENSSTDCQGIFLDLDNNMEVVKLPEEIRKQYLCQVIKETEDVKLANCIMHYKNSRSYQCLDFDNNILWEEKHKAYRYTLFEEKNGCVIFGTAGHGGGVYCYSLLDGVCLCEIDTKGTYSYGWNGDRIVCQNREGALIIANPFENRIEKEIHLDSKFIKNSGFYADKQYICAVGFEKKTNSPCLYLFDTRVD